MPTFTSRTAAGLLALLFSLGAAAQTAPAKPAPKPSSKPSPKAAAAAEKTGSLGTGTAGGRMLTRDELRACLKEQQSLKERRARLDGDQGGHDTERGQLTESGTRLKAELDALDRSSADAVNAYNARAKERDDRVDAWNERNRRIVAEADALKQTQELWKGECGDRRYREDDEIAIRQGR